MREILFRGKRIDNDEWVEGDLLQNIDCIKIREHEKSIKAIAKSFVVYPETVGQYTGFTDKNGRKIFEGDIVKFNRQIGEIAFEKASFGIGTRKNINYQNIEDDVGILSEGWNDYSGCYNDNFISLWEIYWNFDNLDGVEVIGNIYDNPELLEDEE